MLRFMKIIHEHNALKFDLNSSFYQNDRISQISIKITLNLVENS